MQQRENPDKHKAVSSNDIKRMVDGEDVSILGVSMEEYGDVKRFGGIEIDVKEAIIREENTKKEPEQEEEDR